MANQANIIDNRLAQIDIPAKRTLVAAEEPLELARNDEHWWAHAVNYFGSSAVMLKWCCINQRVFDELYVFAWALPDRAWRGGVIQTNRDNSRSC